MGEYLRDGGGKVTAVLTAVNGLYKFADVTTYRGQGGIFRDSAGAVWSETLSCVLKQP
jgi:hypothetical protein